MVKVSFKSMRFGDLASIRSGKTPPRAVYRDSGDIRILKFRDLTDHGTIQFKTDESGWVCEDDVPSKDLRFINGECVLITNAAHSSEHIGKKVSYIGGDEDWLKGGPVAYVGELTAVTSSVDDIPTYLLASILSSQQGRELLAKCIEGAHLIPRALRRACVRLPNGEAATAIVSILRASDEAIAQARDELTAARRVKTALMQRVFVLGLGHSSRNLQATQLGPLPPSWTVERLSTVLESPPFNGVSPASRPEPPGTPILNVGCVKEGECNLSDVTFVDFDDDTAEKCAAHEGDFFVLRGNGNRTYVASGGLLRSEPDTITIFSDKLIRLRFNGRVVPRFIPYMWQSATFLRRLQSKAESGSGLWMISKREIRREWIALPGLAEQEEIVAVFDQLFATEKALSDKVAALERLKKSLMQNLLTGKMRVKPSNQQATRR